MTTHSETVIHQLLCAAWQSLNDAAADLSLVVPLARGDVLADDARVLANATEREAEALFAVATRWHNQRGDSSRAR